MELKLFLYIILFLLICNWFQLSSFLKLVIGPKIKTEPLNDKWIKNVVKEKTGFILPSITLFKDEKMYGMMAGLPFWPKMILSEGLYKNFNKDELEWVVLHEAGHHVMWHNIQAIIIEFVLLSTGIYIISKANLNMYLVILLSIISALVCIQVIRWVIEYTADKYSIMKVDNPNGVITAQDKFRKNYNKNLFNNEKSLLRFLLHWNIYPSKRIEMAKKRLM